MRRALSSGWSLPSLKDLDDPDMGMKVLQRNAAQCGAVRRSAGQREHCFFFCFGAMWRCGEQWGGGGAAAVVGFVIVAAAVRAVGGKGAAVVVVVVAGMLFW